MINVGIVEDHQNELDGLLHDLEQESDISVVATATSAALARVNIVPAKPDIVIMDLVLPDSTGAALIVELRLMLPETSFLVLSAYEDYERIYGAILAGAVGYLGKAYVGGHLAQAIREVHAGGSPMSSPIARKVLQAFQLAVKPAMQIGALSEREQEIVHILATGRSYQDIASTLFISIETVRTHIRNIYRKLQINSRAELNTVDLFTPKKP
ncbi:MAG: response regulator transcription factor [Ignavibacteria bacterium]|nr:response regulator transcription factor [Ignavibacteria bacterium]MBK7577361.1 response regulator transcription factor [Ignavibacteria bacterium]MBK9183249.1 response regulator transcription factor [Ignavibacteria bacterium]